MVPPGRLELPLPKEPDFESGASTNSATGAHHVRTCINNRFSIFFQPYFRYCIFMTKMARPISQLLVDVQNSITSEKITVSDFVKAVHREGFGFMLFLFALPAALPLPGFGVNFIIAAPLLFLTFQQAIGRQTLWFPAWLGDKKLFSKDTFNKIIEKAMPHVKKIEKLSHPRLNFITHGAFSIIIGIAGLIMALSVLVPLPLTNTVPSFGIALMAIGTIMNDGLAVIAGAIIGLLWVAFITYGIIFLGMEGVEFITETVKSYLYVQDR